MSGVNKAILIGYLGQDPELRQTQSGLSVARVSIATNKKVKGEDTTTWHNLVFFDKQAEIADKYLRKGSRIFVEGEINNRKYEKDGQTRYVSEIIVRFLQMLDSKSGGQNKGWEADEAGQPAQGAQPTEQGGFSGDPQF